jgi:cell division protease FtsH
MNILKKAILSLSIIFLIFDDYIISKSKITGLAKYLFPLPVKLYNAGRQESTNSFNNAFGFRSGIQNDQSASFFTIVQPENNNVSFDDVAGLDNVKDDLNDVINYIKNPTQFQALGALPPQGILMTGEPGNGKTLLAKALAGQAQCTFIHVNGIEFCNASYVGIGIQKMQQLFTTARQYAPCIIFIDEIDSIGSRRVQERGGGAIQDHNNTLMTLLVEMDGFTKHDKPIIIIGATNRVDDLDRALIRPGRFDRVVYVNKPYQKDRVTLLTHTLSKKTISKNINITLLARLTKGFSGAELTNLVNEAAILATKNQASCITMKHCEQALANIKLGKEIKTIQQNAAELWTTAIHEAGHTIAYIFQDKNIEIYKVSIIPRERALGATYVLPIKEMYNISKTDMLNTIICLLAGRCAEEIFNIDISTGATQDLERAQKMAYNMIIQYGMSDEFGYISLNQFKDHLPSDIRSKIHQEIKKIIQSCKTTAYNLLLKHKNDIAKIADLLIKKQEISAPEIYQTLNLPYNN